MSKTSQEHHAVVVQASALPDDGLMLRSLRGRESLGRPFKFTLELLSTDANVNPRKVHGTPMTIKVKGEHGTRELDGIVSRFSVVDAGGFSGQLGGRIVYRAILRPRLWLLSRASHCRFFFDMSALDIAKQVLDEHRVDYRIACQSQYPKIAHCTQYQETDLHFLQRLLEREGIYYFFEHRGGRDTLVLIDSMDEHSAIPDYGSIDFEGVLSGKYPGREVIYKWSRHDKVVPGRSEVTSFDFENVRGSENQGLIARASVPEDSRGHLVQRYEPYYDDAGDGRRYARARLDASRADATSVRGKATACGLWPGGWFQLARHPRDDQNSQYLVTEARYRLSQEDLMSAAGTRNNVRPAFTCRFTAIPRNGAFRMARSTPAPRAGVQTAIVVAPDGDKFATDKYGRVKVQFHWEQFNPPGSNKRMQRCWVRVAQSWAGKGWGAMFLPRAGQEVIVAFLDGDIDHPVVVGCLYNSANTAPYRLPAHGAVSTLRTEPVGTGGKDARNELRFNDKDTQMLLYAGGRYDNYVRNDGLTWIGKDAHHIVEGRQLLKAGAQHVTVEGAQAIKVKGGVSMQSSTSVNHKAGTSYTIVAGECVHIKGVQVLIEATGMVSLKSGGNFVSVDPAGVQISGTVVQLNTGGAAAVAVDGMLQSPAQPEKADDGSSVS